MRKRRVGITYDLKSDHAGKGLSAEELAELDSEETIAAIEEALGAGGFRTERIGHADRLYRALERDRRWDIVFNIAEGLRGLGRESLVPALLDAHAIPYVFSDPLVHAVTLHKAVAKRVLRDLGIPTPDFAVVSSLDDTARVRLRFPVFAKPVAEGSGKGISAASRARNRAELVRGCRALIRKFRQPVLVERYLSGREFTVGVIGTAEKCRVLGAMEVIFRDGAETDAYSYTNKQEYESRIAYADVAGAALRAASALARRTWIGLGGRDAGRIDMRMDSRGRLHVLEVNTLPGLNPRDSDLAIIARRNGIDYESLIGMIMRSAFERLR